MRNIYRSFSVFTALLSLFVLFCLHPAAAAEEFTDLNDYQRWAAYEGYPRGLLIPIGLEGINQDYFRSLPDSAGYSSGRIVIGDSRSCQLGILQERTGADDYAVFAVWGGHYVNGSGTPIMTGQLLSDVEQCFQEQIRSRGKCTVFFCATVNDYDYQWNNNAGNISAAVAAAEWIGSMTYEYEGKRFRPQVVVIGFDGVSAFTWIPQETFDRYLDPYNESLLDAVKNSPILTESAPLFTTVPEITGGKTTFISDGLHYSDAVLQMITARLKSIE